MLSKFFKLFFFSVLLSSCTAQNIIETSVSTGINKNPRSKQASNKSYGNYSIQDVEINFIRVNKLTDNEINYYNDKKLDILDHTVKTHKDVYNYNYEYVLGPSDIINIDLTESDDIDDSYKIDENGMIDLPVAGKVKISDLKITEAHNILRSVIREFYKNPDLQITVEEFNSSKVYVVGAVKTQITINLNQEPIKLIEAAIKAGFDRVSGTKGFLRRDNNVYKINLENAYQSIDDKENFYLKKNDVIFIDTNSDAIHVFGEVIKPGVYYPNLDYSLTELISTSGLNQLTANAEKVYVIRENYEKFLKIDVFILDISSPINFIAGRKFKLQPKDIVYIPPTKIVKWNRVISLLLPQTDLFNSYNPIIQDGVKGGANANQTGDTG